MQSKIKLIRGSIKQKVPNKIAKKLSYVIPVLAFTLLLPIFEYTGAASVYADNTGVVLGAFTRNPEPKRNLVHQVSFDEVLDVQAKAVLVYEPEGGLTLLQRNEDKKLPIASLTKLMTALVAQQQPDFSKPIVITSDDRLQVAPILGVRNGDSIMPADLVKAMLVGSANDAAWTLANHFGGREAFVNQMNAMAEQLGLKNTHYSNPVGFDSDENYSTAADLKVLAQYALDHLPYSEIWQQSNYSFSSAAGNKYFIKNSNRLIFGHNNIKSIKTGLTPMALGNMIVQAENDQGDKIVAIVLGTADRDSNTLEVINYIYRAFSWE